MSELSSIPLRRHDILFDSYLVAGFEHFSIHWESSSQLTNSYFSEGYSRYTYHFIPPTRYSIGWFKGKITGNSHIFWGNPWFPVDFPLSQPIEIWCLWQRIETTIRKKCRPHRLGDAPEAIFRCSLTDELMICKQQMGMSCLDGNWNRLDAWEMEWKSMILRVNGTWNLWKVGKIMCRDGMFGICVLMCCLFKYSITKFWWKMSEAGFLSWKRMDRFHQWWQSMDRGCSISSNG